MLSLFTPPTGIDLIFLILFYLVTIGLIYFFQVKVLKDRCKKNFVILLSIEILVLLVHIMLFNFDNLPLFIKENSPEVIFLYLFLLSYYTFFMYGLFFITSLVIYFRKPFGFDFKKNIILFSVAGLIGLFFGILS